MSESCAVTSAPASGPSPLRPASFTRVLLIERDADCADALEVLLAGLPGVQTVRASATARLALTEIVDGYTPSLILLDACMAADVLATAVRALRLAAPHAAIVVLCLYPETLHADIASRVDAVISKDTRRSELTALLAQLRS